MKISAANIALAIKIQEAADLSSNDIASRLRDAIQDYHRGSNSWGYYQDHFGDATSGDVIYSCDGDMMRAGYELSDTGGAAKCVIDFEHAEDVVPRTIYEPEAEEDDHYAAMSEALKAEGLYASLPLYERFISKAEREKAGAEDFAGKGKSFPILKPEDVTAAARSIGRAGSGNLGPSGIKARIIAIAKRKGWEKYLPKAWQTTESKESVSSERTNAAAGSLLLQESSATLETIQLQEARADYEIKLIAPGKGATAFYPAEVLKRDGAKAFPAETKIYLNHPNDAQESAGNRDVNRLAGVLTSPATYHESHAKGPGLYARMKVFADHAPLLEDKAKYLGMSIMASGQQAKESGRLSFKDGLPLLASFDEAGHQNTHSVDVVPIAGAGGMILTEAARGAETTQGGASDMDEAAVQKLIESAVKAAQAPLLERAIRGDAREEATRLLESISLPEASKARVVNDVLSREIPITEGALDKTKFAPLVEAAAKTEGAYVAQLTGGGRVFGMGAAVVPIDAKEAERRKAEEKEEREGAVSIFESLGLPKAAAEFAARGRAS